MNVFSMIGGRWVVAVCAVVAMLPLGVNAGMPGAGQPIDGPVGDANSISAVINEVLASNAHFGTDPQGQYDDWIELHNPGNAPVNLGGMYLTDDPSSPTKWQFPTNSAALTTIAAQGYLLVWADGEIAAAGLHAAFKLSSEGETIALFDRDGTTLIDSVTYGVLKPDISYGRVPDDVDTWLPLTYPTPGMKNICFYDGFVEEPRFSPEHGFYDTEILVTITSATQGATILYTTDGSDPYIGETFQQGSTAVVYTGPIRVSQTTCLRAAAIKADWGPSANVTSTYLFAADILKQSSNGQRPHAAWPSGNVNGQVISYGMDPDVVNDPQYKDQMADALISIPSISLVTDLANLFNAQKGIYVNAGAEGRSWERPVSVELIDPNGGEGFQVDAGLRIRGGFSRSGGNPKHSFRLFFRNDYGAPVLRYPLFGSEGAEEFENIDLRTSQNYAWSLDSSNAGQKNTFVREEFCRDLQRETGRPYTRTRYYHLYLNGQYWGLYETQERSEASYAATYFGGQEEDYDVIMTDGYRTSYTDGTIDEWNLLWELCQEGFAADEQYYAVQGKNPDGTDNPDLPVRVDVGNLIDYMIGIFYTGNDDAPVTLSGAAANNFFAIRNRNVEARQGWIFFAYDNEHSLGAYSGVNDDRTGMVSAGQSRAHFNPQWLHQKLMAHSEYRMQFADHVHKHFFNAGVMTPEKAIALALSRAAEIDLAILGESARWGDQRPSRANNPFTYEDWWEEVNGYLVETFFPVRTGIVLSQLRKRGLYPAVAAPVFNVNGAYRHGGYVSPSDTISMTGGAEIWYTLDGSDPRIAGSTPQSGDELTLIAENAAKRVLVPTGPVADAWKTSEAFDDSGWISGAGGVGFERSTGYETLFTIDVQNQMYSRNGSCYVRIPFEVDAAELEDLASLTLKVRYDDGFIVYLNGTEIARRNFGGQPAWNSMAEAQNSDDAAVELESLDVTASLGKLKQGSNLLAVQAMNLSTSSSDFLFSAKLVGAKEMPDGTPSGISPTAIRYTGPITLSHSTQIKARVLSNYTWSALNEAVYAVGPVAESLRISEIQYHPAGDPNAEFIELTNAGTESINLNLVRFAKGIQYTFPSYDLAPGGYCLLVRDLAAFEAVYGNTLVVAGQYTGSLDNSGERIELLDAVGTIIESFQYNDNWFDLTDGVGFSLTRRDPSADPDGKSVWQPSAASGGSPGTGDSGQVPELGSVVINELMANPSSGSDWIELYNTTDQAIDLAGWFLSDDANDLTRYRIAEGTSIAPGGYLVFTQDQHFANADDPGCNEPFGLSKDGETLYLHSGSSGVLTGYSEQEKFDASEAGVSMGRWQKSTGSYNFVALSQPTPGAANAEPVVGPIVITEILYHPTDGDQAEYVELLNISDATVTLYDQEEGAPWRLTDDPDEPSIDLLLPSDPPVTLEPGQYLVIAKDLSLFHARYTVPAGVEVLAWGLGKLDDGRGKVQLSRPGEADDDGTHSWLRVDRISYSDGSHPQDFATGVDPWPLEADGQGQSLNRIDPHTYGNDPANWQAAAPSPGRGNP